MHTGKRVLITAAAKGIGLATAEAFAAAGAKVHICDIDAHALHAAAADPAITTSLCDVADRAAIERMMAEGAEALGGIDVLVNNAGIAGETAPVETSDPDRWESVLAVNLAGTFNVTRLAIPHLKRSDCGSIVIMSSVAGRFGYRDRSAYATTKWGLVGLTKTLSIELGPSGIRVNGIMPGAVDGERIRQVFEGRASRSGRTVEAERELAYANQSVKRFVQPEEIAALILFLASDAARSISGQMLPIDGDSQTAG